MPGEEEAGSPRSTALLGALRKYDEAGMSERPEAAGLLRSAALQESPKSAARELQRLATEGEPTVRRSPRVEPWSALPCRGDGRQ